MLILARKTGHNDGFGSQFQRVLGIFCLAKEYNLQYLHVPFVDVGYQGLKALEINKNSNSFVEECNKRIEFLKTGSAPKNIYGKIDIKWLNCEVFKEILKTYKNDEKNIIVYCEYVHQILDKSPEMYRHVKDLYKPQIKKNKIFTIGVHVRRGELYVVDSHRMLPNSYYINIVKKIIKLCKTRNLNFIIELYTEVSEKETIITGKHPGICNRINEDKIINPENNKIEEFDCIPNLKKYINEKMFDTFDRMVNCDILITSRSSFSTVASYLKNGISIYHNFWHGMMKNDIEFSDPNFNLRVSKFLDRNPTIRT